MGNKIEKAQKKDSRGEKGKGTKGKRNGWEETQTEYK